jgi:hypothetical protein
MKKHASLYGLVLGASLAFTASVSAQVTLASETFADGLRVGPERALQWYSTGSSPSGTANTVVSDANFSSGKAVRFYSGSSNGAISAVFTPVTLVASGDYVQISSKVRYTDSRITNSLVTGPVLGLYNSGGTALSADGFGSANYTSSIQDDIGYRAMKYAEASGSDMKIYEHGPVDTSYYNFGGTVVDTESSGVLVAQNLVYTVSLRIELQANLTDIEISYTFSGGTPETTYTSSVVRVAATTTFDNAVLLAFGAQSGYDATMGDILITSNIPEPATYAALAAVAMLGLAVVKRRRQ